MTQRFQVQVAIAVGVVVFGASLALDGVAVQSSWLRPFSLTVGLALVVLMVVDRWLWNAPLIRRYFKRPDISGVWKGSFESTWRDGDHLDSGVRGEAYLVVRETLSTIRVHLYTSESVSGSLSADLVTDDVAPTVTYLYRNTPRLKIQERSRIHDGAARLSFDGDGSLVGHYWTDRDSKGELRFSERLPKRWPTSFGQARGLFSSSSKE